MPDAPTLAEQGKGAEIDLWFSIWLPAGTPPAIIDRLSRESANALTRPGAKERHAAIGGETTSLDTAAFKKLLAAEGKMLTKRKVVLRLPNFLGIGGLVASTDMMITVPQRVAETLLRIADVKVFPPPFEFPSFAIKQHWHERYQHDPASRWLRSVISDLFLER
jgi:DNA-binding transcriptional LysR family regulator